MRVGQTASRDHLCEFYGTDRIEVDDDHKPPFVNRTNTWKMYYKVGRAHRMAIDSGKDFDLFIRIRPDQRVDGKPELDWAELAAISARQKILYLDISLAFTNDILKLGDQFLAGGRDAMDVYAGVSALFPVDERPVTQMFDAPETMRAHATAGYHCLYNGVIARGLPGFKFQGLLNPTALSPAEILDLLRQDTSERQMDEFDCAFLQAAEAAAG